MGLWGTGRTGTGLVQLGRLPYLRPQPHVRERVATGVPRHMREERHDRDVPIEQRAADPDKQRAARWYITQCGDCTLARSMVLSGKALTPRTDRA
jgi:hypothetical protein